VTPVSQRIRFFLKPQTTPPALSFTAKYFHPRRIPDSNHWHPPQSVVIREKNIRLTIRTLASQNNRSKSDQLSRSPGKQQRHVIFAYLASIRTKT